MHPILFRIPLPNWNLPRIGPIHDALGPTLPIYSYGVMLGLSFIVGWYLTLWLAEKDGLPKETMANCYVVTAIAALVGSRLLYVVTNLNEFNSPGDIFALRRGGLVAYGGFLGGYLGSWVFLRLKKIRLMPWADVAVPSLATGLGITRIGCYLFGCDFGKPLSDGAPGFLVKMGTFPHWAPGTVDRGDGPPAWIQHVNQNLISHDAASSLPVHPTQIYESLLGWGLFALLMVQRKHQKFRGQVFMLFAFTYGFGRFLLEIVRDDLERGAFGPELAAHLLIPGSLALFAVGYSISFANSISNITMRRLTQALAFIPAVVAYVTMRPSSFMNAQITQLSTSQWVGLLTALAVSVAFTIFYKAAQAHPEAAMALNLPGFDNGEAAKDDSDAASTASGGRKDDDAQGEPPAEKPKKKKKAKTTDEKKDDVVDAAFDDTAGDDKQASTKDQQTVDATFDDDKPKDASEPADPAGKTDDDKPAEKSE